MTEDRKVNQTKTSIEFSLKIRWERHIYGIMVNPNHTISDVKLLLYGWTKVKPSHQTFYQSFRKVISKNEICKIKKLNIDPDYVLEMLHTDNYTSNTYSWFDRYNNCVKKLNSDKDTFKQSSVLVSPNEFEEEKGFLQFSIPRLDKKLLILDIDFTIYDLFAPSNDLSIRPYLQKFLKHAYTEYDIGLWSATDMDVIRTKIINMGILESPDYDILFVMDKSAMSWLHLERKVLLIKSLDIVWSRFSRYNKTNTIICDDVYMNFYANLKNGILIDKYSYRDYKTDNELLKLLKYLERISDRSDVSKIDHSSWRKKLKLSSE